MTNVTAAYSRRAAEYTDLLGSMEAATRHRVSHRARRSLTVMHPYDLSPATQGS